MAKMLLNLFGVIVCVEVKIMLEATKDFTLMDWVKIVLGVILGGAFFWGFVFVMFAAFG
jgi:hypothetical protein